ncbi:circularly permutated Ras protein 1 isoform 1-T1 [Synchiropus picturatus]
MEFACGFVYISPPVSQKDSQRPNVFKRSALLPPTTWIRPRTSPPPPPSQPADVKPSAIQNAEERKEDVPGPFYENAEFHRESAASSQAVSSQPSRKKALLPPHMRPAARSPSPSSTNSHTFHYELPKDPDLPAPFYETLEETRNSTAHTTSTPHQTPTRHMNMPEYVEVLPSRPSVSSPTSPQSNKLLASPEDKGPLPGNPNVLLVSVGKLLSEEEEELTPGQPSFCSQCGSYLDSSNNTKVNVCYFCGSPDLSIPPPAPKGPQHRLFLLNPDEQPHSVTETLLLFCIDISGSMSMTSQVSDGENVVHKSRLEFVQEAVLQCVWRLMTQQPDIRVGLITFNHQVTLHGYDKESSYSLAGEELRDVDFLKEAAATFPSPPPLSQTQDLLQTQVRGLSESGTTALGPAALLSIAMASRHQGSKVIICTDGKANIGVGNLEEEDLDARTLLSSTIFYQELGEYAANHGVTVSVLSIEGTDCRLDELGRLADRTGGKVVVASPNMLHPEFEQIIENRTIATHCSVTLMLPKLLTMKGEREAAHKGTREVGNVDIDTEITFQFAPNEHETQVIAPPAGSQVSVQLQVRYRRRNGERILRVLSANREVTYDSSVALSSLSLAIIQLNSSQASAALAVRGRFLDAQKEGEQQRKLIERAIKHNRSAEDKQTYHDWVKTMEPIYSNIYNFTRKNCVISDSQSLTDAGAALLYAMKHCNRKSISLKKRQRL